MTENLKKVYPRNEVMKETLQYFKGDELAAEVWINKYCLKDSDGNLYEKSPKDMHWRLAGEFARIESKYPNPLNKEKIFETLDGFNRIVPQGGSMSGIGNDMQIVSLSNCFVVGDNGKTDSYGGILKTDQEQVQLMKRRGGCIWEYQKVYTRNNGLIYIKDVEIGDEILSYNIKKRKNVYRKINDVFYTDVKKENQISLTFNNGSKLKTSLTHPLAVLEENGYIYKKPKDLKMGDICLSYVSELNINDQEKNDIAWFIGAFIGDGTYDLSGYNKSIGRFRLTKDNQNVVEKFNSVLCDLNGGNTNVYENNEDRYEVDMWNISSCMKENNQIYKKYFNYNSNEIKTYTATTPNFILNNKEYWLSYIAGIIDTDGHIKDGSSIHIDMCAENIINDIAYMLNILGIRYSTSTRHPKRKNEQTIYRIRINQNKEVFDVIKEYMYNNTKIGNFRESKEHSLGYPIFESEKLSIKEAYDNLSSELKTNNLFNSIKYMMKTSKIGINLLNNLLSLEIINNNEYYNYLSRIVVKTIEHDEEDRNYIDLKVQGTNNYFGGEFGLINTHNCGHDMSHIRPNKSPVKNAALTSAGIVPFMERYSNSTIEVGQEGRRGALMLSVSIKHPDAEDFIDAKMKEGKVTGANVSVKIDNEFMKAVKSDKDYIQTYPVDLDITKHTAFIEELSNDNIKYDKIYNLQYEGDNEYKGCYAKKINARKLWEKIIHNAWKSAEPGILFWDNVINEAIPDNYGEEWRTVSTNPCVSKNTKILTENGYIGITDKLNEQIKVWNGQEFSEVTPTITGYNQKMYKIGFSDGSELECTDYHKFYTWKGYSRDGKIVEKEAKELKIGDKLEKYEFPSLLIHKVLDFDKDYYTLGFFAGDGFIKKNNTNYISLYGEKKSLIDKLNTIGNVSENIENDRLTVRVNLPDVKHNSSNLKKYVPYYSNNYSTSMMSWLAGIIDSDGSRNSEEGSISISSIDREFLMDIKLHILNVMGVNGSVIDEKEGGLKEIKGHEYKTNKSYRLIISAHHVKKLYDLGLRTNRVKIDDVNPNRDAGRFIKITSIERIDDADVVYCFKEEKRGRGCFNGVVTGQCGEIPLCPYDSCRLLALNLYGYVENPFTDDAKFNEELFKKDVQIAQRYMDDIVDLEVEKIDKILEKIESDPEDEFIKLYEKNLWIKIKEKAIQGRRTGLGVTGEGDMLAALGLTYGTDNANIISEKIHKQLKLEAYRSSVQMAKERGAFAIYEAEKEDNNPFIDRIKSEDIDLYTEMQEYGRRNISLLTVAPTGTVSIMTQTTSGIEPVFLPVYKRRRKINPNDKDVRIDYVDDTGIAWMEYPVFHHKFEVWLKNEGYDISVVKTMTLDQIDEIVKKSPYYKATSNDVDWVKKVEMQGMIQKHVDHSISVTVNLPEDVSEETVSKVYETGWATGCKGITVYRDGSRSGVLISDKERKMKEKERIFTDIHAPKRPKRLKADIVRFQNNLEKWIAVVGIMDGRPYEIFTGRLENGLSKLPPSVEECEVVKNIIYTEDNEGNKIRTKSYDIEYIDNNGEKHTHTGLNHTFNSEYWNYAKLISGVLRHGMPMEYVYELIRSLDLNDEHLNTWKAGVERVIKRYIKDGAKTKNMKCPVCGSTNLEFKEGCLTCMSCGSSKCG